MSRSTYAVRSIFWGIFNRCIGTLVPFLTRTLLIYTLGNEYIGLNSLFTSILGLLNLSELGIGTALVFSMYEPLAKNDTKKVCACLNLYRKCYSIIGAIILIIGAACLPFLDRIITGDYPDMVNIYTLYLIYLMNTLASYWIFSYKKSLLIACQRVDIQSNINSLILLLQNILQFILVLLFRNYYFYVLVLPICTIAENITISLVVDKKYPEYQPRGKISLRELGEIKQKIAGLLFQRLGNVVLTSVDSIVISAFLGLSVLGTYNNYYFVITAIFGFLAAIQTSLKPIVGNSIVLESHEKNLNDFFKLNFIYIWIVSWATSVLLCLYQPFIELWAGAVNVLPFEIMVLMVVFFYTYKWGDMLFVYQEAAGFWWKTRYVPLIAAVLNLFLNIVLVQSIGLAGIPISTIISLLLVYDFGYAKILFAEYFGKIYFIKFIRQELQYMLTAGFTCVFTYCICSRINTSRIASLFIRFCICLIVPNLILFLFYRRNIYFIEFVQAIKNKHFFSKWRK